MTDITAVLPKLQHLVRILATDNDGERLNAVRMIGRVLGKALQAFSSPSLDEVERIERLLVLAYDAGARP